MLEPKVEGEFEPWSALQETLRPLLEQEVAGCFLPWTQANAAAIAEGADTMTASILGGEFSQKPQKYHAKSYAVLKAKRGQVDDPELAALLEDTGCAAFL